MVLVCDVCGETKGIERYSIEIYKIDEWAGEDVRCLYNTVELCYNHKVDLERNLKNIKDYIIQMLKEKKE